MTFHPQPGALDGLRVLDFSLLMAGPYCARYLADLGADVVKIEPPTGEYMRHRPPIVGGVSSYFGALNCGKRSVLLDLKNPDHVKHALTLVAGADVVIENFRPGVMARLGLGPAQCRTVNPRIIYCSISGFGQSGPDTDRPALAQIIHAESGYDIAFAKYQSEDAAPPNCAFFVADVLAGIYAFSAINAALYMRERTGIGQNIDVALMDCMLNLMVGDYQHAQFPTHPRHEKYGPIRAADGLVIVVPVIETQFQALSRAVGRPEWITDERFSADLNRRKNWVVLMSLVEEWTKERPADVCVETLSHAGVPCGRYRSIGEAVSSPQFAHRGSFARVGSGSSSFDVPNLPFRMSQSRVEARTIVPHAGEHTAEVLRQMANTSSKTANV